MSCLYLSGEIARLGEIRIVRRWLRPGRRWRLAARIRSFGLARLASSQLDRRTESKRERRARRYVCATAPAAARTRASIPVGPVSRQAHFTLTPFLVVIVPCVDRGSIFDSRSTTDRIFAAVTGCYRGEKLDDWWSLDERCDLAIKADNDELLSDRTFMSATVHVQYTLLQNWEELKNRGIRKMRAVKERNEWET